MSQLVQTMFGKLPIYWRLATLRCAIYALTAGWSVFKAGTNGYDSLSAMTKLQLIYLFGDVVIAMVIVWIAFLDNTIAKLQDGKDTQFFVKMPDTTDAMKKFGLLLIPLVIAATFFLSTGCKAPRLDPAGVYQQKFGPMAPFVYTEDQVVSSAVDTVGAVEKWELENYAFLVTNSPNVVIALAGLREQTKKAALSYKAERDNLSALITSTNAPELLNAASNSIVTTVGLINSYSGKATAVQQSIK